MTVALGSLVLDDNLELVGVVQPAAALAVYRYIDGGAEVMSNPSMGGQIGLRSSLSGSSVRGRYTSTQVEAIRVLAAIGIAVQLQHPALEALGEAMSVVVDPASLQALEMIDLAVDWPLDATSRGGGDELVWIGTVNLIITG